MMNKIAILLALGVSGTAAFLLETCAQIPLECTFPVTYKPNGAVCVSEKLSGAGAGTIACQGWSQAKCTRRDNKPHWATLWCEGADPCLVKPDCTGCVTRQGPGKWFRCKQEKQNGKWSKAYCEGNRPAKWTEAKWCGAPPPTAQPTAEPTATTCHELDLTAGLVSSDGLTANLNGGASHQVGTGVVLDGSTGYISLQGLDFGAWPTQQYTIEVCLDMGASVGPWARIYDFGAGQFDNLMLAAGPELRAQQAHGAWETFDAVPTYDTAGKSKCYAVTSEKKIYVDGGLVGACSGCTFTLADSIWTNAEYYIGKSHWSSDPSLDATVKKVRVCSAALPTADMLVYDFTNMPVAAPTAQPTTADPTAKPTAQPTFQALEPTAPTAEKTECLAAKGRFEGLTEDFCGTCCPACTAVVVGTSSFTSNFVKTTDTYGSYWDPNDDFPGCACLDLDADDYTYYGGSGLIVLTSSADCARITGDGNEVSGGDGNDAMYSNGDDNSLYGWGGDDHLAASGSGNYLQGGGGYLGIPAGSDVCTDLSGTSNSFGTGCETQTCLGPGGVDAPVDCETGDPFPTAQPTA